MPQRMSRAVALLLQASLVVLLSLCPAVCGDDITEAVEWLKNESRRIIRASKRRMNDGTAAFPPQVGLGYEAFWLRDFEYTLEGSIASYSDQELTDACLLFVRSLRPGDFAGTDCVKFDGTPIYKPGFGTMGLNPVADGSQFTVGVAFHTFQRTQNVSLVRFILPSLVGTMGAVPRCNDTGLVHIVPGEPQERCPYGFTDSIEKQGAVLFSSLLFVQACRQMQTLMGAVNRTADARDWEKEAERVALSIRKVFWSSEDRLFLAATVQCAQADIWGSAFAVTLDVASPEQALAIAQTFRAQYPGLVQSGQLRHLPPGVYWAKTGCARDTYQNGAFWGTPVGWFVYTLDLVDTHLANATVIDMVAHYKAHGACEWIFNTTLHLPNYLASAALPLAGIEAMVQRRRELNHA